MQIPFQCLLGSHHYQSVWCRCLGAAGFGIHCGHGGAAGVSSSESPSPLQVRLDMGCVMDVHVLCVWSCFYGIPSTLWLCSWSVSYAAHSGVHESHPLK